MIICVATLILLLFFFILFDACFLLHLLLQNRENCFIPCSDGHLNIVLGHQYCSEQCASSYKIVSTWTRSESSCQMATNPDDDKYKIQFLDLNDDCLLEILKYLSAHEVLSLLGCLCRRIDYIIYERLALVKHLTINLRVPPSFTLKQLEILGRHLRSLYISAGYSLPSTLTLNYLEPICGHQSLRSLTLHYVQFDESYQKILMNVAPQLQFLDLSYCQLNDDLLRPILERCEDLRTLTIFGNYNLRCNSLRLLKYKKINEIKVEENWNCKYELQKFIDENPQVTVTLFTIGYLGHMNSKIFDE